MECRFVRILLLTQALMSVRMTAETIEITATTEINTIPIMVIAITGGTGTKSAKE